MPNDTGLAYKLNFPEHHTNISTALQDFWGQKVDFRMKIRFKVEKSYFYFWF